MEKVTVHEAQRQCDGNEKLILQCSSGVEEKIVVKNEVQETIRDEEKPVNIRGQSTRQSGISRNEQKLQQIASDKLQHRSSSSVSMPLVEKRTSGRASDVKLDKRDKYRPRSLLESSAAATVGRFSKGMQNQSQAVSESLTDHFSRMRINYSKSFWFV